MAKKKSKIEGGRYATVNYPNPTKYIKDCKPRRKYWGNLYDEDTYKEDELKQYDYDYSDYDREDDHDYTYSNWD